MAVVVPQRSSSSRKKRATSRACAGSCELALGREGIGFQPWQQAGRGRGDHVGLRVMDMGVDEARHDQLAAQVVHAARRPAGVAASCA